MCVCDGVRLRGYGCARERWCMRDHVCVRCNPLSSFVIDSCVLFLMCAGASWAFDRFSGRQEPGPSAQSRTPGSQSDVTSRIYTKPPTISEDEDNILLETFVVVPKNTSTSLVQSQNGGGAGAGGSPPQGSGGVPGGLEARGDGSRLLPVPSYVVLQ